MAKTEPERTDAFPEMPFHPLADLFPLQVSGPEYEAFKEDIRANGQRVPILTYGGKIIDGRRAYQACKELGREPRFEEWTGEGSLLSLVASLNLHRRHLTASQRAMVAAKLKEMFQEEAKQRMLAGKKVEAPPPNLEEGQPKGEAAALAAELLKISRAAVYQGQKVLEHGSVELQEAVETGEVTVSAAADLTRLPPAELAAVVAGGPGEMKEAAAKVRGRKRERRGKSAATPPPSEEAKTSDTAAETTAFKEADSASVAPTFPAEAEAQTLAGADSTISRSGIEEDQTILQKAKDYLSKYRTEEVDANGRSCDGAETKAGVIESLAAEIWRKVDWINEAIKLLYKLDPPIDTEDEESISSAFDVVVELDTMYREFDFSDLAD